MRFQDGREDIGMMNDLAFCKLQELTQMWGRVRYSSNDCRLTVLRTIGEMKMGAGTVR
jgi:hypothetical protein